MAPPSLHLDPPMFVAIAVSPRNKVAKVDKFAYFSNTTLQKVAVELWRGGQPAGLK
jgi:hypothetical protein